MKTFSISAMRLVGCFVSCVFARVALWISFKNFSFATYFFNLSLLLKLLPHWYFWNPFVVPRLTCFLLYQFLYSSTSCHLILINDMFLPLFSKPISGWLLWGHEIKLKFTIVWIVDSTLLSQEIFCILKKYVSQRIIFLVKFYRIITEV